MYVIESRYKKENYKARWKVYASIILEMLIKVYKQLKI